MKVVEKLIGTNPTKERILERASEMSLLQMLFSIAFIPCAPLVIIYGMVLAWSQFGPAFAILAGIILVPLSIKFYIFMINNTE